jgi:3-hydroxyacyl-[acyl-carrier-protein] dehydratase
MDRFQRRDLQTTYIFAMACIYNAAPHWHPEQCTTMSVTLQIECDHPALPGHFPGQPIVPAVVILERVITEIQRSRPDLVIGGIRKAKFVSRLTPGKSFQLEWSEARSGALRFQCRSDNTLLAEGSLVLAAARLEGAETPVA